MTGIEHIPPGYRYLMITAALIKRALLAPKMPPGERLELLEQLNSLPDAVFTTDLLVAIKPMTGAEAAMVDAAASLDGRDDERSGPALTC